MASVCPTTFQPPSRIYEIQELLSDEFASKLLSLARANAERYAAGKPFPHIYFDDFLPTQAAEAVLRDFPEPQQVKWSEFDSPLEKKLAFDVVEKLPRAVRDILYFMNSRPMLEFLEILTGINGVIPIPITSGEDCTRLSVAGSLLFTLISTTMPDSI